jgi:glutamate N-acetyltransferase/amino-acid acetyltransferase
MMECSGGVTAPKGFQASGVHCGVKSKNTDKKDVALIVSDVECSAAAVYTLNKVKADPIYVTMEHLADGKAWGFVANSGNANACAPNGREYAKRMCELAAGGTGRKAEDFAVCSTGVIGQELNISVLEEGIPAAAKALSPNGSDDAAVAIMTTDLYKKDAACTIQIGGKVVTLGAIAKGSGMIHPNMGTMLACVTTDCAISPTMLQKALTAVVKRSFNRVTVDGDTSTNDTLCVLANGLAGNEEIVSEDVAYMLFFSALEAICVKLSKDMAADGEGATKLICCTVSGAEDEDTAEILSKSVVGSSLVKAAMFGEDANWGRVLCAMGYAGVDFDPQSVDVKFASAAGTVHVCCDGMAVAFSEEAAKVVLGEKEIQIDITISGGEEEATCWGCDLTYDYVKINGDYRT